MWLNKIIIKWDKMNIKKIILIFTIISTSFSQEIFNGLLLFSPTGGGGGGNNGTTYLMDNNENTIHTWSFTNGAASMPYLMPDSSIIYPYRVSNPTMNSGGVGGGVAQLSWDGEVLWNYVVSNSIYQHHHDVEPLPNGNILVLVWEKKTNLEAYNMGRTDVESWPTPEIWSTAILELNPDSGLIVWEWHLWDHLIQDADSNDDNFGVVADHPELFDINKGNAGTGSGGPGGANADWMHLNAISYNSEYDQIVISSRTQCEIFVIDHSTTTEEAAGHTGGIYGKGGDFLYRWGNPQNYDRGNNSDNLIGHQHSINWIPDGYPGEGNFILFNNDGNEAIEFSPPIDEDGFYIIEDGQPYGPDNIVWSSPYYSTDMQGGAFRLPNGNTLITDCDSANIEEVTESGSIVWSYSQSGNNVNIARAQKYAIDYFDEQNLGDINSDGTLNILDIVSLINLVLSNDYESSGDINEDNILNILDIVQLVNIILN